MNYDIVQSPGIGVIMVEDIKVKIQLRDTYFGLGDYWYRFEVGKDFAWEIFNETP